MIAYVLTMVIAVNNLANSASVISSFSVAYSSKERCEAARTINREALTKGSVILATCTPQ